MKLFSIELNGYKRFQSAVCNVDGPIVAFVGPNESGKSSLLGGLAWLTDSSNRQLSAREQNRRKQPEDEGLVVRAKYRIDEDDISALNQIGLDVDDEISPKTVTQFRFSRTRDGSVATGLDTTLSRNLLPFKAASDRALSTLGLISDLEIEEDYGLSSALLEATQVLPVGDKWTTEYAEAIERASESVATAAVLYREAGESNADQNTAVSACLELLLSAAASARTEDPVLSMRRVLGRRVPKFLLFTDTDRDISETYDLAEETIRAAPPAPLRNILHVAGTNVDTIWNAIQGGDAGTLRTLERQANEQLQDRLRPMWTQSDLSVDLALNRDGLVEVNILEVDSPDHAVVPISERSDGLRSFLGLVCFLITADLEIPPVLLIDEAERNLHYDAQADLIRVLTQELNVHKVIYTTHSPGCLPMDLGTGIRVVKRNPSDPATSSLQNDFWLDSDPGFSPLLFAMGAEAAAFSVLRKAVLAEGVSEMILLPTMLRNATDGSSLDFHVAFGLSNMEAAKAIGSVALVTTFLVDGDEAGDTKIAQLVEAGVPPTHAFQLPNGTALEDLVDRSTYLKVVSDFLNESGRALDVQALDTTVTIARAVDDYAKRELGLPSGVSHKIIAFRLANLGTQLKLSKQGKTALAQLRKKFEAALKKPYTLVG